MDDSDLTAELRRWIPCPLSERAVDTIERLSAEKSELKNKVDFLEGVMACDQIVSNELAARIAALEAANKALLSGQPTEVNGESWQLVPVKIPRTIIDSLGWSYGGKFHGEFVENWLAVLTASASEQERERP